MELYLKKNLVIFFKEIYVMYVIWVYNFYCILFFLCLLLYWNYNGLLVDIGCGLIFLKRFDILGNLKSDLFLVDLIVKFIIYN